MTTATRPLREVDNRTMSDQANWLAESNAALKRRIVELERQNKALGALCDYLADDRSARLSTQCNTTSSHNAA